MFVIDIEYNVSLEEIDTHLAAHRDFLELNYQKDLACYTITEFSPVKHRAEIAHLNK